MRTQSAIYRTAVAVCGTWWLSSTAVNAQIAPGYSGDSTTRSYAGAVAWRELETFGKCFAVRNKDQALRLVGTDPGSRIEIEVYKALFRNQNQSCLGSITDMRAPYTMVRGAIAEGLYKQHIPLPASLALTAPTKEEPIVSLTGAARCLVAEHADEVKALVTSTWPGSPEEGSAIQRLLPAFGKCVPAEAKVQYSPTQLRFRFAEVLYRMSLPQPGLVAGAH